MRNPAQKSSAARLKYSEAGGSGIGSRLQKRQPGSVGDLQYHDEALAKQDQRTISDALGKLVASEAANDASRIAQRTAGQQVEPTLRVAWGRRERAALRAHGLIDPDSDELTEAGRERVKEMVGALPTPDPTPTKESLGNQE